jgi:copper resistance protein B
MKLFLRGLVGLFFYSNALVVAADHHHHQGHTMSMPMTMPMLEEQSPSSDIKNDSELVGSVQETEIHFDTPSANDVAAAFPVLQEGNEHAHHSSLLSAQIEKLELHQGDGEKGAAWDGGFYVGNPMTKLWLKSEGERMEGVTEYADLRLLVSQAISPWWEGVAGLVGQKGIGPDRSFLMLGVQGETPYFFDLQANVLVGNHQQVGLKIELENDLLITNKLILQTRSEMKAWSKADLARDIAAGVSDVGVGMRLRYEIRREFAPYIGFEWSRKIGNTADVVRSLGERDHALHAVAGFRLWW